MSDSTRIVTAAARKRRRVGVRMRDGNVYAVPDGMTPEEFARINNVRLSPRSRDRKPPPGVPPTSELHVKFGDEDPASDNVFDELVYESRNTSAVPRVSSVSAIPTLSAAEGFERPVALTPWREVTRRHGNTFLGKLELIKVNGVNHVKTEDLKALEATRQSRGSRKRQQNPTGAETLVSREIKTATAARQKAFRARQRKVDEHERQQRREYRPR